MATKTWKIGEYAKGGVITVELNKNSISIIGKDWDTSAGFNRNSDQSKAKEFCRAEIQKDDRNAYRKVYDELSELTTHYYATEILEWIESKVKLTRAFGF